MKFYNIIYYHFSLKKKKKKKSLSLWYKLGALKVHNTTKEAQTQRANYCVCVVGNPFK